MNRHSLHLDSLSKPFLNTISYNIFLYFSKPSSNPSRNYTVIPHTCDLSNAHRHQKNPNKDNVTDKELLYASRGIAANDETNRSALIEKFEEVTEAPFSSKFPSNKSKLLSKLFACSR